MGSPPHARQNVVGEAMPLKEYASGYTDLTAAGCEATESWPRLSTAAKTANLHQAAA